jgi:hypothetical protein
MGVILLVVINDEPDSTVPPPLRGAG